MRLFILLLIAGTAAASFAVEIGAGWEFNREGDSEGWTIEENVAQLAAVDGGLTSLVDGERVRLLGPQVDIPAADFGFLVLRMRALRSSSALLRWKSDSSPLGFLSFELIGDGRFHEYVIPLHEAEGWTGRITRLSGLTFFKAIPGTNLVIDYLRIVRLGPRLEMRKFRAKRITPKPGEPVPLEMILRNTGDGAGSGIARLSLPSGIRLLEGESTRALAPIAAGAADTARWTVSAGEPGDFPVTGQILLDGDVHADSAIVLPVVSARWEQREFLLTAWSPPAVWATARERGLGYYGEANFKTLLWVPPGKAAVDSVARYGMRCLINVGSIVPDQSYLRAQDFQVPPKLRPEHFAELDGIIDKFRDHPAVIGYFIVDEPGHLAFENLSQIVARIRRRDPTRLCYINQHPSSAGPAWFGPRSYREVLEHYLDVIQLELLSYDRYTFFEGGDGPDFFKDLATVRRVALDYGVPFANIVQAVGDETNLGLNWRIPKAPEHRWLAYNSLAYGARSLMWFHWNHTWGVTGSVEQDRLFASIRNVNAEINTLAPFLMRLRSTGAYHVGEIPPGGVALPDTVLVRAVEADADMVVGLFEDEAGNDYFMVVNDYEEATTATVMLDRSTAELLTLDVASGTVRQVPVETGSENAEFEVDLRPGAGRLFFFTYPTAVVTARSPAPERYGLGQNYPNPFNPVTTISFETPAPGTVKVTIYDALGQEVEVLVDGHRESGHHAVRWSAPELASGVYLYALEAGGRTLRRKMTLLR